MCMNGRHMAEYQQPCTNVVVNRHKFDFRAMIPLHLPVVTLLPRIESLFILSRCRECFQLYLIALQ